MGLRGMTQLSLWKTGWEPLGHPKEFYGAEVMTGPRVSNNGREYQTVHMLPFGHMRIVT